MYDLTLDRFISKDECEVTMGMKTWNHLDIKRSLKKNTYSLKFGGGVLGNLMKIKKWDCSHLEVKVLIEYLKY